MADAAAGNGTSVDASPEAYLQNPAVIAMDWIGFFILFGSSLVLVMKLMSFKGPSRNDSYFFGYRESKMISVYVNLFAAIAYWAKVSSHANKDAGGAAQIHFYKYADYLFTCPILTIDLLWTLNLPYKFTFGTNVFCCIICAMCASIFAPPARYMWFCFGVTLFADSHAQAVSKTTKGMLKTALMVYFSIWCGYPTLWVLKEARVIDPVISHCLHVFLDVFSKSAYGFALLKFQLSSEKREFNLAPIQAGNYGYGQGAQIFEEEGLSGSKASFGDVEMGYQPSPSKTKAFQEYSPSKTAFFHGPHNSSTFKRRSIPAVPQDAKHESFPVPGQYMAQHRLLDVGPIGAQGMPARRPKGSFESTRKVTDAEMASTMEQIQELNAQLSQMMNAQSHAADEEDYQQPGGNVAAPTGAVPNSGAGSRMKQMFEQDVHGRNVA